MEGPHGIGDLVRELAGEEIGLGDEPLEVRVLLEEGVGVFRGGEERDPLLERHPCEPERLHQVGVGGDQHRQVVRILESIHQEVGREIHVRALLFGLHDPGSIDRIPGQVAELLGGGQHHAGLVHQEVPLDDRDEGVGPQCPQVEILPLALPIIGRTWMHPRGEILDGDQDVLGAEQALGEGLEIEPLAGRAFLQGAVIEIEPVHVDSGTAGHSRIPQNSASHPKGGSATSVPEGSRGSHCRDPNWLGYIGNPSCRITTRIVSLPSAPCRGAEAFVNSHYR